MKSRAGKYCQLFEQLTDTINKFIGEVNKHKLSEMATKDWTVKDELCHIAFWHEYYAQNYAALAAGTKPFVFSSKGGSTRNQEGVDKLRHFSKKYLINLLNKAHSSLYKNIVVNQVPKMTYIVGKEYKTDELLEMIIGHIFRHTKLVKTRKIGLVMKLSGE